MMKFDYWILDNIFTPIAIMFRHWGVNQWILARNSLIGGVIFLFGNNILGTSSILVKSLVILVFGTLVIINIFHDLKLINMLSMSDQGPLIARESLGFHRLFLSLLFSLALIFSTRDSFYSILGDTGLILYWSGHYFMAVILPPPPPPKHHIEWIKATAS